jgi:hypothetical protein
MVQPSQTSAHSNIIRPRTSATELLLRAEASDIL